jgi:hypothetical protein
VQVACQVDESLQIMFLNGFVPSLIFFYKIFNDGGEFQYS